MASVAKKEMDMKIPNKRKILLVDDNYDFYTMMKQVFDLSEDLHSKMDLDYAPDGFTALHMSKKYSYDAIVCDIQMPHLDGIKLVSEFAKKHYDIPFIMISGEIEKDTAAEALQVGAYNVLQKPLDPHTLLEKIELAIELRQTEKISSSSNEQERAHIYNMLKMYYYDVEKIILQIQHFQIPLSRVQEEIKKKRYTGKCMFDDLQNLKYYSKNG